MDDSANEALPEERKPTRRWIWWGCAILVLVLLASISIPVTGVPAEKAIATMNCAVARGIYPGLKMYGGDHGGHYPRSLYELEPDYLASVERTRYRGQESGRRYDWLYIQGLSETSPAKWIVLASPTDQIFKDRNRRTRIVVYNDGSASFIPGEEFDRQLAAQLQATPARAPEKP